MNEFGQKGSITEEDFMIPILNNLPEDNDVILDRLKNQFTMIRDNTLAISMIHKNLNHRYKKSKIKKKKKSKRACTINNISNSAESVVSMATNLGIRDVIKI